MSAAASGPGAADAVCAEASGQSLLDAIGALRSVILAGEQLRHAIAEHFGVGLSDTVAMGVLSQAGALSPRELADRVGLNPSTVTTLLDRLATANLAVRQPHPSDRRKTVVVVTDHGTQLLNETRAWMAATIADLDTGDLPQTHALLSAVAAALESQAAAIKASKRSGIGRA